MATLTGEQLKDSYQSLVTIGDSITSDPTSGALENGKGTPLTAVGIGTDSPTSFLPNGRELVLGNGSASHGMTIFSDSAGTGNLFFADGTTGDEAYRGFLRYNHADDTMVIFTAGANERMRIDSSGNVGMNATPENSAGTWRNYQLGSLSMAGRAVDSAPDAMFGTNFKFTTANAEQRISAHATSRIFFNDDVITFQNAGSGTAGSAISWSPNMTIDSSGRVGIGTSSPDYPLVVASSAAATLQIKSGGTTNLGRIFFGDDNDLARGFFNYDHNTDNLIIGVNNAERMRIDSSGNVGIGTTDPDNTLHVYSSSTLDHISIDGTTGINRNLNFSTAGTTRWNIYANSAAESGSNTGSDLSIARYNDAGTFLATAIGIARSSGAVTIAGSLSKGSGSFKIDHPLESKKDTHHLVHSFVESPQANNIYRGSVDLVDGQATVNLDEVSGMTDGTFVLLNTDIHVYTSNESDWDAVKGSVSDNVLTIECQNSSSTAKVNWLVIGERHDQHMIETDWTDENGKVIVEPLKPAQNDLEN